MCIGINGSQDKIRSGLGSELTSNDCAPHPSAIEPAVSSYARGSTKEKSKKTGKVMSRYAKADWRHCVDDNSRSLDLGRVIKRQVQDSCQLRLSHLLLTTWVWTCLLSLISWHA